MSIYRLLSNVFQTIAEGEEKTEIVRQVLAEQVLFEPYTAFKRLDQQRQGYVGFHELIDFFEDNKITYQDVSEVSQLMDIIDIDSDGMISYTEYNICVLSIRFSGFILPRNNQQLYKLANMRESYFIAPNMLLPYEVEWALARIFDQELRNQRLRKEAVSKVVTSNDWDSRKMFDQLADGHSINQSRQTKALYRQLF